MGVTASLFHPCGEMRTDGEIEVQGSSHLLKACSWRMEAPCPVAQLVKNLPAMQETWVRSLGREDPLERDRLPTPVFWPGEFHGQSMGSQGAGHK